MTRRKCLSPSASKLSGALCGRGQPRHYSRRLKTSYYKGIAVSDAALGHILGISNMISEGSNLSNYRIVSKLGAGGMGEVYLAEDSRLGRQIALKVLSAEIAKDQERLRRFMQEARSASALNHPNILTIHEFGVEDDLHYLATEFVDGETLRERIRRDEIPVNEALEIAEQIAFALSAAHEAGITHRDIKPENVMIRRDGIVKLLDFGLAKLIEKNPEIDADLDADTATLVKTHPGVVMGTAAYMSPEQARGREIDERTDIWSWGVVMYEMLTRCQPFTGETFSHTIVALQDNDPPPLARFVKDYPVEIERIIKKALEKSAEGRYQTAEELLADVRGLRKQIEVGEELSRSNANLTADARNNNATYLMPAHAVSTAEYVTREIKRRPLAVFTAVAVCIIAVGLAAYFAFFLPPAEAPISSVAVLPFENGSGDANLDYLSDGLSESVIDKLSQLPQLKVISRSSSFKYRGPDLDLKQVASALDVQAIITGRVVQRGDDLSVRVEMVDVRENKQLWGEQYARKLQDAVNMQREIAQTVSEKLKLRLSGAQEQRLTKSDTANAQAYELLLKGKYYDDKGGTENRLKAREFYEQAVAADPNYAPAHARLSAIYRRLAADSTLDPKEFIPKAEAEAKTALELDDSVADAHLTMGNLHQYAWRWMEAEREYKRGIDLSPNLGVAHRAYSQFLSLTGRHDEAIAEAKRARELDPVVLSANASVGYRLCFARRYDEAIAELNKVLEMDADYDFTQLVLGYAYSGKGMYKEAIAAYQEAVRLGDDTPSTRIYLGAAYAKAGEIDKANEILRTLLTGKDYVSPGELAVLHGALGDKEAAFASLEKGYAEHDLQLQFLFADPAFAPLRDDPRFEDLLRRVGFPQ